MNPFDPMPTIRKILGAPIYLPLYQEVIDARLLEKLDDFEPPRCENIAHLAEPDHHSGGAAFLFISPCGHGTGYVCAPFVQWILRDPMVMCSICDLHCPPSDLTFIPIGGQS